MKKIVLLALTVYAVCPAIGSHLRCGYIRAQPSDCSSRTYDITLTVYTNTDSQVQFGEDGILNFGDGTSLTVPAVAVIPRPDLGPDVGVAQFTVSHAFLNLGTFLISYVEPNRNGGVLNIDDSFVTPFYIETSILINTEFGCTTSPTFLTSAVLQASAGTAFTYSMGVSSAVDDFITYELVTPFRDRGTAVNGYIRPGNLAINYLTGLLTWDTELSGSSQPGEYNFAVQVNQHTKVGETYTKTGFVRIDFQVIVNGDVENPVFIQDNQELDEYSRLLVPGDTEKKIKFFFESAASSTLEVFSELAGTEALSFETYDSTHEESNFKVGMITLTPHAAVVRENPYLITVRANSGALGADINYLIYTEEILELPVITPPVITAVEREVYGVDVYPNPVQDKLIVRLNRDGVFSASLFTVQGLLVRSNSFESETEVTLSDLPPGLYLCEVRINNSVIRKTKVVKL
jgi:hypothetical protein